MPENSAVFASLTDFESIFLTQRCTLINFTVAFSLFTTSEVHQRCVIIGHSKWIGAIKEDFCVQKSPRNYLPSLCNCLRLNWSFQLLHLGYNLHDKQQGRHSLAHTFFSRSACPRLLRLPAISINSRARTQTDTTLLNADAPFLRKEEFKEGGINK